MFPTAGRCTAKQFQNAEYFSWGNLIASTAFTLWWRLSFWWKNGVPGSSTNNLRFSAIRGWRLKNRQSNFKWCLRNRAIWKTRSWRPLHRSQMNHIFQYQMWCNLPLSIINQKSQCSLMSYQHLMWKKVLRMWNRSKRHLKPTVTSPDCTPKKK